MGDHAITLTDISLLLGILTLMAGLWYRLETRVSTAARDALDKAELVEDTLQKYKLEVAENYAKQTFIREVETRLVERFDAVVAELHGMRGDFQKAMVDMAKNGTARRRT